MFDLSLTPGIFPEQMGNPIRDGIHQVLPHDPLSKERQQPSGAKADPIRKNGHLRKIDHLLSRFPAFPAIVGVRHEDEITRVQAAQFVP